MPIVTNTRKHLLRTSSGIRLQPGENTVTDEQLAALQKSREFKKWKELGWSGIKLRVIAASGEASSEPPADPPAPPDAPPAPPQGPEEPAPPPIVPPSSSRRGRSAAG